MSDQRTILRGGAIVTPQRVVTNGTLVVEDGRIAEILEVTPPLDGDHVRWVSGLVVPGFVDLHCDALEREIRPRPTSVLPIELALTTFDRTLAAQGITTMFHAVAFAEEEGARHHRQAEHLAEVVRARADCLLVRHRVHARYELTDLDAAPTVQRCLERGLVQLLSFMDHTPGERQFRTRAEYVAYFTRAYGLAEDGVDAVASRKLGRKREGAAALDSTARALGRAAQGAGIPLASHDDDSEAQVAWAQGVGVSIAEFPVRMEAASAARERGLHVVMGAPNVVRGGSTGQNLAAAAALAQDCLDGLCSDYYPAALLHAVMRLHAEGACSLGEAVAIVTHHPARAVGLDRELGSLEVGRAADVVVIDIVGAMPVITRTLREGREIYVASYPAGSLGLRPRERPGATSLA